LLVSSQESEFTNPDLNYQVLVQNSDLIVSAKISEKKTVVDSSDFSIYTQYTLLVSSTIKGLDHSSVYFLVQGGEFEDRFQYVSHNPIFEIGESGTFMLSIIETKWVERVSKFAPFACYKLTIDDYTAFIRAPNSAKEGLIPMSFRTKTSDSPEQIALQSSLEVYNSNVSEIKICDTIADAVCSIGFGDMLLTDSLWVLNATIQSSPKGLKFAGAEIFIDYDTQTLGKFAILNKVIAITATENLQQKYSITLTDMDSNRIRVVLTPVNEYDLSLLSDVPKSFIRLIVDVRRVNGDAITGLLRTKLLGNVNYACGRETIAFGRVNFKGFHGNISPGDLASITYQMTCNYPANSSSMDLEIEASSSIATLIFTGSVILTYNPNAISYTTSINSLSQYQINVNSSVPGRIEITIDGFSIFQSLITLNTIPRNLLTLTFSVVDCNLPTNLMFDGLNMQLGSSYFPINGTVSFPYIPVNVIGGCGVALCCTKPPQIDYYISSYDLISTEKKIRAGMGDIMTIYGSNFGPFDVSSSRVTMVDADQPMLTVDIVGPQILLWSENEIRIMLPGSTLGFKRPPGSGEYFVETKCGKSNTDIVNIIYSILGVQDNNMILFGQTTLLNNGTSPELIFSVNENLHLASFVRDELEFALNAWCGKTNINWQVSSVFVPDLILPNDFKNVVAESTSFTNSAAAAAVIIQGYVNTNMCPEKQRYFTDVDIKIKKSVLPSSAIDWPSFQTTFRNILKHELGHAHCLNHAIDPFVGIANSCEQPIMYYTGNNCSSSVQIKPHDVTGATTTFQRSQVIVASCLPSSKYSEILNTGCLTDTDFPIGSSLSPPLEIQPNPNFGLFHINFPFDGGAKFCIYDVNGVARVSKMISVGVNSLEIEVKDFTSGIYFVTVTSTSGVIFHSKFVKL
jgi:Secretion system C-terminal sorting domain